MKKKLSIRRKNKEQKKVPSRITNETVAEHRERVIAGGRKFKYPIQYARHKLVINAIIIAVVSMILLAVAGWAVMYPMQNSGAMAYRITRVVPLPVGSVNGERVLYSDYLASYRSSEYYLNPDAIPDLNHKKRNGVFLLQLTQVRHGNGRCGDGNLATEEDGECRCCSAHRDIANLAERIAYARQLARQHNISVSDKDVDEFIDKERMTVNGQVSQETYDASIRVIFGESVSDYRFRTAGAMLESRVAFAIDSEAKAQSQAALDSLKQGKSWEEAVAAANSLSGGKATSGASGLIDVTGKFNGLRVASLAGLKKGDLSDILQTTTGDGYFIAKITEKTDSKLAFEYVHIPLTKFSNQFKEMKKNGKVSEYISVPEV